MSDIKLSVSIVIPHWNNVDVLSECLESILNTDFENFETIVVDNASIDDSVAWVRSNYPNVKLIENDRNHGYAGGCNIGAEAAIGDYIIFLNNDTVQDKNWISNLIKIMNSNDNIAAVQPKILNYYDRNIFDYAGGAGGHMDIYCFPFARGRIFSFQENDEGQYNEKEKCFWSSGTCFMIRTELFQKAGGFDVNFFSHMEEIDLCWRLYAMGFEVWAEPNSIVYHKNALTLPMYSHKKYYLNHRNSLLMLLGNYSYKNIFLIGLPRIFLELAACFYSMLMLDWKHLTAILRSIVWIISNPSIIIKKRKLFSGIRKIDDESIISNMMRSCLVIKYYFFRKRTYLDVLSK